MVAPTDEARTLRLCVVGHLLSSHSPLKDLTHIVLALAFGCCVPLASSSGLSLVEVLPGLSASPPDTCSSSLALPRP